MVSKAVVKNPVKQRAGAIGARARWGPGPRVVRLDSLAPELRALVLALLAAAEAQKETAPTIETSGAVVTGGTSNANQSA